MNSKRPFSLRPLLVTVSTIAAFTIVAPSLASALPGDVVRVGPTRALMSISDGVAAVDPGDVVLVDAATYMEDVHVTEGIAIVVDGGAALIEGRLTVTGIPGGQQVLIAGLTVAPPEGVDTSVLDPAVGIVDARGAIHFQDCDITGASGFTGPIGLMSGAGGDALCTELAFDVVVQDCVLRGGGGGNSVQTVIGPAGAGGCALQLTNNSQVTVSSSIAVGGFGGVGQSGGMGGTGTIVGDSSELLAYSSSFRGGDAGPSIAGFGEDGGDGLVSTTTNSLIVVQMCVFCGGMESSFGFPSQSGEPISGPLAPTFLDGNPCTLQAPNFVADGQSFAIQADDVGAGGQGALIVALGAAFRFALAFERPLLVGFSAPSTLNFRPVPAGALGSVTYSFDPNPPPVGEDSLIIWTQMTCSDVSGGSRFSEARAIVLLAAGV